MSLLKTALAALPFLVAAALSSCSTPPPKGPMVVHTEAEEVGGASFGGQVVVNSVTTNATVLSIDSANHRLLLRFPSGAEASYRAGNQIPDFAQIKVGDQLNTTVVEECAVLIVTPGAAADPTNRVTVVPGVNGVKLSDQPVGTVRFTAQVVGYDYFPTKVRLQLRDGTTRTVRLGDAINVNDYPVGATVSVLVTEAVTVSLEKQ